MFSTTDTTVTTVAASSGLEKTRSTPVPVIHEDWTFEQRGMSKKFGHRSPASNLLCEHGLFQLCPRHLDPEIGELTLWLKLVSSMNNVNFLGFFL